MLVKTRSKNYLLWRLLYDNPNRYFSKKELMYFVKVTEVHINQIICNLRNTEIDIIYDANRGYKIATIGDK